jgi:tetratricopeptide (TPR) repeat protein
MTASTPGGGTRARAARLGATRSSSAGGGPVTVTDTTADGTPAGRELNPDELAALEEQREFLLTSLRDLEAEHDAGDVDDHDYDELKDDYTARAAGVIRAVDSHHQLMAARRPRPSWSRRLLAITAVVLVAVLAGVLVARSAGQRNDGDTITGGVRQSTRDDLLAARQKFGAKDFDGAIAIYDSVLTDDPANLEALTYRGWMYRLKAIDEASADPVPSLTSAIRDLKAALAVEPTDGTALTFLAVLYGDLGRPADALATLDKVGPGGVPASMASTVATFRQEMQAQVSGSTTTTG